jgi:hypothetical protein
MSVFVLGPRDHAAACRQRAGHPPVLCGCRTLGPTTECVLRASASGLRPGGAIVRFLHRREQDIA